MFNRLEQKKCHGKTELLGCAVSITDWQDCISGSVHRCAQRICFHGHTPDVGLHLLAFIRGVFEGPPGRLRLRAIPSVK
jgi:hypothetical protein